MADAPHSPRRSSRRWAAKASSETMPADFDESDRLHFVELSHELAFNTTELGKASGVVGFVRRKQV